MVGEENLEYLVHFDEELDEELELGEVLELDDILVQNLKMED
jgi:hypothetical protein